MKKTLAGLFFVTCSLFGFTLEEYKEIIENEEIPWMKQGYICQRERLYIKNDAKECLKAANMVLDLKGKKLSDVENNTIKYGLGSIERTAGFNFFWAGDIYGINGDHQNQLKMYEKAIKYENTDAFFMLGIMYYDGIGASKNHIKAYKYLKEALEFDHPNAQDAIQTVCSTSPWACK